MAERLCSEALALVGDVHVRTASDASETHPMFKPPKVLTMAEGADNGRRPTGSGVEDADGVKTWTASETRTLNLHVQ